MSEKHYHLNEIFHANFIVQKFIRSGTKRRKQIITAFKYKIVKHLGKT